MNVVVVTIQTKLNVSLSRFPSSTLTCVGLLFLLLSLSSSILYLFFLLLCIGFGIKNGSEDDLFLGNIKNELHAFFDLYYWCILNYYNTATDFIMQNRQCDRIYVDGIRNIQH